MTAGNPIPSPRRAAVLRLSLIAGVAGLAWAALILATGGGPETNVLGLRIRSHDPMKPVLLAALALTVRVLAGGSIPLGWLYAAVSAITWIVRSLIQAIGRIRPQYVAWSLAAGIFGLCLTLGTRAIGGSDSYGYVSEADLWLKGRSTIDQSFALDVPWPKGQATFAPLAYLPWSRDGRFIVPTCAPGFPLLLAAAKAIGGHAAVFWVVPLGGAAFVLGTFYLVRRLASPAAGAMAAWLVATSPPVLFLSMTTMTDVPNAAVWTAAFCVLLRRGTWSELAAGLLCGVAAMIRPNLGPLVAFPALYIFMTSGVRRMCLFSLGVVPGAAVVVIFNDYILGAVLAHGSGEFSSTFLSWSRVPTNIRNYAGYLLETHTPIVIAGVVATFVPLRWLWPGVADRRIFIAIGLFIAALWAFYFAYDILPAWWYLRFMLPTWPFLIGGVGAVAAALMRGRGAAIRTAVICGVIALGLVQLRLAGDHFVWINARLESRYIVAAQLAERVTDPHSVIVSMQHAGSLRYYSGRMTMRFDMLDQEWLDRAVDWLSARGVHTYMVLEDWEVGMVRARFPNARRLATLERPIAIYRNPEELFIYDLSAPPDAGFAPVIVSGLETGAGFGAVGPRPLEPLAFK